MQNGFYRSVLRVSLAVTALVLIFDSGYLSPLTKELSDGAMVYVASGIVGVVASVEPNELNVLTAELTSRERELDLREAALGEREIAARDFGDGATADHSTYVLSIILFMLTILVLFNYFLDWRRLNYARS